MESDWGENIVAEMFAKQASDQIEAAGSRPVRWYFSQKQVADYAKKVFDARDSGLENIKIVFEPSPWRKQ